MTIPGPDPIRALELPRLVPLARGLTATCFSLMKLLPARVIVDGAIREQRIDPTQGIVESTSGTFGLGLAMVAATRSLPLVLVSDPVLDADTRRRIEALGAQVHIVEHWAPEGGYQRARLERLTIEMDSRPGAFHPCQYDNPANPHSYAVVAELIADQLGPVDFLVGPVGSGGSLCGTGRALRQSFPDLQLVAVDTHGSVLFGHDDRPRLLRGLGNSLLPENLEHTDIDEVHWVAAAEAYAATRALHKHHGMFMGPTSGAAWLVAQHLHAVHAGAKIVVLMPDEGHRYAATVHDPQWTITKQVDRKDLPSDPVTVTHPREATGVWDRLTWKRKALVDIDLINLPAESR